MRRSSSPLNARLYATLGITTRKQTELDLQRSQQQLKVLSQQLIEAQERERQRMASDLHDGIGQSLSALFNTVEGVSLMLDDDITAAREQLTQEVLPQIRTTIEELQHIVMDLRPTMLDDLGIVATLEWFIEEFEQQQQITTIPAISVSEQDIPDALKVPIFRITQEALNNVAKHSRTESLELTLTTTADGLLLLIRDTGQGFDTILQNGTGLGLRSMRERAELSGGQFSLASDPDRGTTVSVLWPRS